MITIVCCIADRDVFDDCLGRSLKEQNVEYKFIEAPLKVTDRKSPTAQLPECYNSIKDQIDTKYVAFMHMDILMLEPTWLERAENFCNKIKDLGVAGVAGVSWKAKSTGYILHGGDLSYAKSYYGKKYHGMLYGYGEFNDPQLSQTLDQQVLIVPIEVFRKVQFDESFDVESPMFMSEDYCLEVKYRLNLHAYALPLKTWHVPYWAPPLWRRGESQRFENDGDWVKVFRKHEKKKWDYEGREVAHDWEVIRKANELLKKKWRGKFNLIFSTVGTDVCPRCHKKFCRCK